MKLPVVERVVGAYLLLNHLISHLDFEFGVNAVKHLSCYFWRHYRRKAIVEFADLTHDLMKSRRGRAQFEVPLKI